MDKKRASIILIEGPNLNLIDLRPKIYQSKNSNSEIFQKIEQFFELIYFQSNYEGEFVDILQLIEINNIQNISENSNFLEKIDKSEKILGFLKKIEKKNIAGVIINPAALTHYSIALSDALEILTLPKVEVHLTNIYKREEFRHKSVTAKNVDFVISGAGNFGYYLAAEYIYNLIPIC